jgi:hypothetical protein
MENRKTTLRRRWVQWNSRPRFFRLALARFAGTLYRKRALLWTHKRNFPHWLGHMAPRRASDRAHVIPNTISLVLRDRQAVQTEEFERLSRLLHSHRLRQSHSVTDYNKLYPKYSCYCICWHLRTQFWFTRHWLNGYLAPSAGMWDAIFHCRSDCN